MHWKNMEEFTHLLCQITNKKEKGQPESEDMKTANSVTYDVSAQEDDILKYFVAKDTQLVQ